MKAALILFLLAVYLPGFCQSDTSSGKIYQIVKLAKDDSTFLALKDTAQAHLNIFVDSLLAHGSDMANYEFAVKSEFVEKDIHEHMWSQIFSYDKGQFKGTFIDSAFELKNIKTGDKVIIHRKDIEDWTIFNKHNKTQMGYFSEAYLNKKEN